MGEKSKKVPAEQYSRVVGYYRPVSQWNKGKQQEYKERKTYGKEKLKEKVKKEA